MKSFYNKKDACVEQAFGATIDIRINKNENGDLILEKIIPVLEGVDKEGYATLGFKNAKWEEVVNLTEEFKAILKEK